MEMNVIAVKEIIKLAKEIKNLEVRFIWPHFFISVYYTYVYVFLYFALELIQLFEEHF